MIIAITEEPPKQNTTEYTFVNSWLRTFQSPTTDSNSHPPQGFVLISFEQNVF